VGDPVGCSVGVLDGLPSPVGPNEGVLLGCTVGSSDGVLSIVGSDEIDG
jgi:hypothetical protein